MGVRITFFDEDNNDISELVDFANGKSTPWTTTSDFIYTHPLLGEVTIGHHFNGDISIIEDGYTFKEEEI